MLDKKTEDFNSFFEEIKKFKEKQDKQKQRGLNDYNMVNVVRKETAEVGMHSNVIFSLINPDGLHYQGDLFLQLFIKDVLEEGLKKSIEKYTDFGTNIIVEAEEFTHENKRIDFTIKSSKYFVGIEMKIDAEDSREQIYKYHQDLEEKAEKTEKQKIVMFYLTKDGKEAPDFSKCKNENDKFTNCVENLHYISFEKHILKWIDSCQKEVRNITNLNEAFENYKDIVKKITNQYTEKVDKMEELLENNQKLLELSEKVSEAYPKAKQNLYNKFYQKIFSSILTDEIEFDYYNEKNNQIKLRYKKYYHICFFLNANKKSISRIGIAINWDTLGHQGIMSSYVKTT